MLTNPSTKQVCAGLFGICALALAAALIAEYGFLLKPCALCIYQRYIYILIGILACTGLLIEYRSIQKCILYSCTILMLAESAIAFYHVGVERNIFELPASCADSRITEPALSIDMLKKQIYNSTTPNCSQVSFVLLGVSMAGWNGIFSLFIFAILIYFIRKSKT